MNKLSTKKTLTTEDIEVILVVFTAVLYEVMFIMWHWRF